MSKDIKILIVDDDCSIREYLRDILAEHNFTMLFAENGVQAYNILKLNKSIDITFLDLKMPEMDGMTLLRKIFKEKINTMVIILTAFGSVETAVEATKMGAYNFLEKPIKPFEVLSEINDVLKTGNNINKRFEIASENDINLNGVSDKIRDLRNSIKYIAPTEGRVLIYGENGTGKELVAKLIHKYSKRVKALFVPVNCAAIPSELVESELFGYKKGAFTGAVSDKKGKFELAENGTIFLDEIGDMSLQMQAKLLRVIEDGYIHKIGEGKEENVDVRIIAATNKNLELLINRKKFREDLYYRLNVITLEVPPLRERKEDIPYLVENFINIFSKKNNCVRKVFSEYCYELFMGYNWPGNVRELKNLVEKIVLLIDKKNIDSDDLLSVWEKGTDIHGFLKDKNIRDYKESKKIFEKRFLVNALRRNSLNILKTAKEIGMDKAWIYKKVKELGININKIDTEKYYDYY